MEKIHLLSAMLTPTVAILGLIFTFFQWRTAERTRQNELFDRRYSFYTRLRSMYLSQHNPDSPPHDTEDWIPLAEEAGFLFGDDIQAHIITLADKEISGSPFFPDENFVRPFKKYLRL